MLPSRNHPINCGLAGSTFSRTFEKRRVADRSFDVVATEVQRAASAASTSQVTIRDLVVTRSLSASMVTDFLVSVSRRDPDFDATLSVTSSNSAVLGNPAANGIAVYAGNGQCVFTATSPEGESSSVQVTSRSQSPVTVDTPFGWAVGSLASHCDSQVNSRMSGDVTAFSQQDGTNFVRNPACWLSGVDLSCASPWNSTGGLQRAGVLISPRHVLFCEHYNFHPAVNATIKFVSMNNQVVTRTITALATHPSYAPTFTHYPDITIGVLDQDVPAGISFAKVLPSNWQNYLPSLSGVSTVQAIKFNQNERITSVVLAGLGEMFQFFQGGTPAAFYANSVSGDSGNPAFLVVNGELVLLGTITLGGPGSGTFVSPLISSINSMMAGLGGGYSLMPAGLSGFPTYSV